MKNFILTIFLLMTASAFALTSPMEALAGAIAKAEGFGVHGTIPTRLHNPGDIRSTLRHAYPGQVGLNKHGYVIFKNDRAGWSALYQQIEKIVSGESKYYTVDMTLRQLALRYATSPTWVRNVAKGLQTTPDAYLWDVLGIAPKLEAL